MNLEKKHSAGWPFYPKALGLLRRNGQPLGLRQEILSGVTVGLIALPLALALGIASIPSGAVTPLPPPALGIVTAIVGGFLISLLGGSSIQIGGPTAAFIPIVLLIVQEHGYVGLVVATMMAGVILIIMGFARLGVLIKYIPWPVVGGFTTGIAVAIMISQLPDFLGISGAGAMPGEFAEKMSWLAQHLRDANLRSLVLAIACVATIMLWPRLKLRFLPGSILAMLLATLFVMVSGWGPDGLVATIGSKFGPGAIPPALPDPDLPGWSLGLIRSLIGPAMAIALLGAIESLLSAVVADGFTGERHDSNTELIAQGVANLVCPLFGGLPATGAIARTSANYNSGGRTPIAGMVHSLTLLAVVLVAAKWAAFIPMAAMSAVLIVVALRMGEWHEMRRLAAMPRSDAAVFLTTFLLTVVFDLVVAVQVGMLLAVAMFVKRVSETTEVARVTGDDMLERPEHIAQGKEIPPGVLVYRIFGPFLFGAAEKMEDALARIEVWPRVLILRLHLVTAMDATGLSVLESVVERMKRRGSTVIMSGIHQQPLQMLRKAGFIEVIGRENFRATFDDSLARADAILRETT